MVGRRLVCCNCLARVGRLSALSFVAKTHAQAVSLQGRLTQTLLLLLRVLRSNCEKAALILCQALCQTSLKSCRRRRLAFFSGWCPTVLVGESCAIRLRNRTQRALLR